MHLEPRMPVEPSPDLSVLARGIVVGDQMHVELLRRLDIDAVQEREPFLVAVSWHALTDHRAAGDIECGEQRRRPMALVVVGHGARGAAAPFLGGRPDCVANRSMLMACA
jgi:hypothetical protein